MVKLAGRIDPETGRPFSLEKIGKLVVGLNQRPLSRERVRQILLTEQVEKPSAMTKPISGETKSRIRRLARERDPTTGLFLYSPELIAEKTGAQLNQVRAIIRGPIKGQRRTRFSSRTREIIRLGLICRPGTRKPLYMVKEIARKVGIKSPSVSTRLIKHGVRRTLRRRK